MRLHVARCPTKRIALTCAVALALAACDDDNTGPEALADVTLSFVAASQDVATSSPASASGAVAPVDAEGTNGTLAIDEIQIVVDEFKLERDAGACEAQELEQCPTFETPPYFLDLPLDGVPIDVASSKVASGTYVSVKLETKDLVSSSGDVTEEMTTLADEVRDAYPEWPDEASLRVAGRFLPEDGGDAEPFVVYFHAEVKVELAFDPPAAVDEDDATTAIVVEIDPREWFSLDDGTVSELHLHDFEATEGEVVEFEAKMAEGFTKVEIGG